MRRIAIRLVPIAIAAIIIWFQFLSAEKVTNEAGREVRLALSPEQEETLGLQSYQEVLSQVETVNSGREFETVRTVAERLARASGKDYQWQVSLVRSPQINAFCLPGGKIVVYTGILPVAQNDAGLATVMGHEMAHATLRHGSERLLKQKATNTLLTGVQFSVGDMSYEQQRLLMAAIGAGAQYGYLLPFSRDHESEADNVGLLYMARAGYDPREAIAFWQRMAEAGGGNQPPEFASSHPAHGTRIERLTAMMPKAMQEYEAARAR
ncbi:MAG: M48 family metallopeptidase [Verrucomicrobiota bacterium]|nr:M48 family metallopeptidase [Verrucomicrobiota bacterium]